MVETKNKVVKADLVLLQDKQVHFYKVVMVETQAAVVDTTAAAAEAAVVQTTVALVVEVHHIMDIHR